MIYRKDIDGLRAIAIILVILCHLGINGFDGGFLGVDIFFVISGFLITFNIITKLNESRFSFKAFYLNRIKRIAPILVFILFVLTIFNIFTLLPTPLKNYIDFLPYAAIGLGNYAAADLSQGYFDAASDRYQLLHTWSLGVEEQFYLIVPVLLFLLWKIKSIKFRNILILFIFLFSIAISVYFVEYTADFKANYYLLHTRFFEIFTGSMLAVFYRRLPNIHSKPAIGFGYFVSILGLFYLSFVFNGKSSWPGTNALIVSLLSAFIIYLGKEDNTTSMLKKVLEHGTMRFVGKISYSLYLWHWVIIATLIEFGYNVHDFSVVKKLGLVLVIMIPLSYLSWLYIENVFRFKYVFTLNKSLVVWIIIPLCIAMGLKEYQKRNPKVLYSNFEIDNTTYKFNHIKTPHLAYSKNKITAELYKSFKRSEYFIGDYKNRQGQNNLKLGVEDAEVLILANSHFHAFKDFVNNQLKDKNLIGHVLHESNPKVYSHKNAEKIYRALLKGKKFLIIWVRHEPVNLGKSNIDWRDWMIQEAIKMGVKPIVYVPGLELESENEARKNIYKSKIVGSKPLEQGNMKQLFLNIPSLKGAEKVRTKYTNQVRWIDMKPLMCENYTCNLWSNDTFALFDKHHITRSIGVNLGQEYNLKYGNMFSINWKQPQILLGTNREINEELSNKNTENEISGSEKGYDFKIDYVGNRISLKKTYDSAVDEGTIYFFHVYPENIIELPPNRQKHGFTNLDVKGKIGKEFFNNKTVFYGINELPNYKIKSISIGHFKPKGEKYFEKQIIVDN
ncbi:MAG: acyltransferase [Maribacter sp.]